jgi:hypothetical protein
VTPVKLVGIGMGINSAQNFACRPVVEAWERIEDLALGALSTTRQAGEQECLIGM